MQLVAGILQLTGVPAYHDIKLRRIAEQIGEDMVDPAAPAPRAVDGPARRRHARNLDVAEPRKRAAHGGGIPASGRGLHTRFS